MDLYRHRKKRPPLSSKQLFYRVLIAAGILLVLTLAVAPPIWARLLSVDQRTVYVNNLPQNLKNIKIAFASDFHCSASSSGQSLRAVNKLNTLGADLVILGGDYGTDPAESIAFFESMPQINARVGVFAVLGDADRDTEHFAELIGAMKNKGVNPLYNDVTRVKIGSSYLCLAGTDDSYYGYADLPAVASQVTERDTVIFAAHSPEILTELEQQHGADGNTHWVDLALFGHTHGGQMQILGHSLFPTLVEDIDSRCLSGWLEENRASILISNGVGTVGFPGRLFATPQVHLITLKVR